MSILAFVCMICIKIFQVYISRTSYIGASLDILYSFFEKKVLYRGLSKILSKNFRKAAPKNVNKSEWSLIISSLLLAVFFTLQF